MRRGCWILSLLLLAANTSPAGAQSRIYSGIVQTSTGAPVAGAEVRVDGRDGQAALTDEAGHFDLRSGGELPRVISVRRIGYVPETLRIDTDLVGSLTIVLRDAALPLDAVVVTASRRSQRLADAPVTVELLNRAEIEATGVSDLARVLAEQTGLQLEGGHPSGEGVMLQGMGSERVLLLVDGQPIVGRISGQIDLSRFPASMVERVEVVKGPQSSLYGSEAMGGVVNVITRRGSTEPWQIEATATGGSQGRRDVSTLLRGSAGDFRYLIDGGRRLTELAPGVSSQAGSRSERLNAAAKLGWTPVPALDVEVQAMLIDEEQRWKSGQLFQFANNRQAVGRLDAALDLPSGKVGSSIYWTRFDHRPGRATTATRDRSGSELEEQELVELELMYNGSLRALGLDAGLEAKRESTLSTRVVGRSRSLDSFEPFAQASWDYGKGSIVPGARLTWSEEWGSHLTPRLAVLFRPSREIALRTSVGQGFRAPAFKELYMEFLNVGPGYAYTVRGNPDLQPETSFNVTGGLEWSAGSRYLRGQLYWNRFDDFIETRLVGDSTGVTVYSYGNIGDGTTRGVEMEGGASVGKFRTEIGYAWLNARSGEGPLLGRPPHSGRALLEFPTLGGFRPAINATYSSRTPVQRTEESVIDRDPHARFDVRLARTLPGGFDFSAGIRNLFDTRPANWPGFEGRHLYLGATWSISAK